MFEISLLTNDYSQRQETFRFFIVAVEIFFFSQWYVRYMVRYFWYAFFRILMGRIPFLRIIKQRVRGHASRENLNFLNITNAGFWHSGRLFALSQVLSLQNLKEFFW